MNKNELRKIMNVKKKSLAELIADPAATAEQIAERQARYSADLTFFNAYNG